MPQFTYTITCPQGLHGRPAMGLAEAAGAQSSAVTIWKGDRSARADRLMALMTLGVSQGDSVTVTVEGGDEAASLQALEAYFKENL